MLHIRSQEPADPVPSHDGDVDGDSSSQSGSSSSSSSSGSSLSGPPFDEDPDGLAAPPPPLPPPAVGPADVPLPEPRRVRDGLSWRWGGFLFTHKLGHAEDSGAWQVTCFRHTSKLHHVKCTKTKSYHSGADEAVLRTLKQWAIAWDQHCTGDVAANKTGHQTHFGSRFLESPEGELMDELTLQALKPDSDVEHDGDDIAAIAAATAASDARPPSPEVASSSNAPEAKRRRG